VTTSLKQKTAHAFAWSAVQSWGVKLLALGVFFVLARYLNPEELGLAQTVILILAFVAILSEQGFQDAIVQRKELAPRDLNLPFLASMTMAIAASVLLVVFSKDIARALHAERAEHLILAAAVIPPITAACLFEIAMRRRKLDFKTLAKASLLSGLVSGAVALILAVSGFGAASLIAQAIVAAVVTAVVLWRAPLWKPGTEFVTASFRGLLSYSTNAFGSRILDFFSGKIIDLIILSRLGLGSLGIYTVGSKLYLTILQLLASTLIEVALSAMAKLSSDVQRLRSAYLRLIFLASSTTLPLFVGVAALAPEVCTLLFGEKWVGADEVTRWLCLLGAVQVVQFFNSSALGAAGKANQILFLNILKFSSGATVLWFADASSISEITLYFVFSQLAVSPFIFYFGMRITGSSVGMLFAQCAPGILSAMIAYGAVFAVREEMYLISQNTFVLSLMLASVYVATFCSVISLICFEKLFAEFKGISEMYAHR
jgi:O-antigen/teichoic acid export membrane protein